MADAPQRSGDQVLTTVERTGMLMAILAPWIAGGVMWAQDHLHYVELGGQAYVDVLKSALAVWLPILMARWHMRRIRTADQESAMLARLPSQETSFSLDKPSSSDNLLHTK